MTILSLLGMGPRSYLCGMVLAGAAGLCGCNENLTAILDDIDMASPPADAAAPEIASVALTDSMGGIKFDDAIYSVKLSKLVIPGAATGNLFLIDPDTLEVSTISGFAKPAVTPPSIPKGGVTSVSEVNGLLYASNQTDQKLYVVDPATQSIVVTVALAGVPHYIRYVETTNELWVTEPDTLHQIEIFSLAADPRRPRRAASIRVAGGPEGLYINNTAKVAYTSGADLQTLSIDLKKRTVKTSWASGCVEPRNILADEVNGLAFVGCGEGGVVAVDLAQGKMVSELRTAHNTDSFGYSSTLRHLYLPGPSLSIVGVSKSGALTKLGEVVTPGGTTQHTLADDRGYAWDLKTGIGQLQRIQDSYPASN